MNSQHLSTRLNQVAQLIQTYVPEPRRLGDIGSDHAYLPCHLALTDQITYAVAGEVVEGPYQSAIQEVATQQLTQHIQVRKGDGLAVVQPEDALNVISICGMGGALIVQILTEGFDKLTADTWLCLQPNIGEHLVRQWLDTHDYQIVEEQLVEDHQRLYEIILAKPAKVTDPLSTADYLMGPILSQRGGALFVHKWQKECQNYQRIQQQMAKSSQVDARKQAEIDERIQLITARLAQEAGRE